MKKQDKKYIVELLEKVNYNIKEILKDMNSENLQFLILKKEFEKNIERINLVNNL